MHTLHENLSIYTQAALWEKGAQTAERVKQKNIFLMPENYKNTKELITTSTDIQTASVS
jgi:membrane glycosyltransferase